MEKKKEERPPEQKPSESPSKEKADENQLVALAREGDVASFEILLRRYERMIYNLAWRILHNREEAADVLQEASFKAFRALPKFAGKSSFGTWFYRIAANLCLMKLRERKKETYSLDKPKGFSSEDGEEKTIEIPDRSNNPAAELTNRELKEALEKEIGSLAPIYRVPFVMFEIEDIPVRQISQALNISESAVKTRLHRARFMLQEKLSGYFHHQNKKGRDPARNEKREKSPQKIKVAARPRKKQA